MTFSRRTVIAGAAALATLPAVSFATEAESPLVKQVMINVDRMLETDARLTPEFKSIIREMNVALITNHGEELFGDRYLRAPVDEFGGVTVVARTRAFNASWQFDRNMMFEARAIPKSATHFTDELVAILGREVLAELRNERQRSPGRVFYAYVPIMGAQAVDRETFQPMLGFKTRYGMV